MNITYFHYIRNACCLSLVHSSDLSKHNLWHLHRHIHVAFFSLSLSTNTTSQKEKRRWTQKKSIHCQRNDKKKWPSQNKTRLNWPFWFFLHKWLLFYFQRWEKRRKKTKSKFFVRITKIMKCQRHENKIK